MLAMLAVRAVHRIPVTSAGAVKSLVRPVSSSILGQRKVLNTRAMSGASSPIAKVASVDHIVLTCADLDATKEFYSKYLGMKPETFTSSSDPPSTMRHALSFGNQKINLHKHRAEFEPKAQYVQPGSADLCFIIETKVDDVLEGLKKAGIEVLEGGKVVERTGARGQLRSVYVRDPDLNLIELSNYV